MEIHSVDWYMIYKPHVINKWEPCVSDLSIGGTGTTTTTGTTKQYK